MKKEIAKYKIFNGTYYDHQTDEKVITIIDEALRSKRKLKIYLGDRKTGRDWCEEHDKTGTIGRSTGPIKIPLLMTSSRSYGGGVLLEDAIVKIVDFDSKKVLYQHPNYKAPIVEIVPSDMPEYTHNTMVNGTLHGRHSSLRSAQICKSKIQ